MEAEEIRKLRLAYPFRPFILVLNDGRRFTVDKPPYVAISPLNNVILVAPDEGGMEMLKPQWVKEAIYMDESGENSRPSPGSKESA